MYKKFIISLLSACLCVISVNIGANAQEYETVNWEDNLYFSDAYYESAELFGDSEKSDVYNVIVEGLKNQEKEIDISQYDVDRSTFSDFFINIVTENPNLFYVQTGYSNSYNPVTNKVTLVMPKYCEVTDEMIVAANKTVDDIISTHIHADMTDAEKALVLHDYLADTTVYDSAAADSADKTGYEHSYTAYGALVNNKGVCQSYTLAYGWLLNKCGIEWDYITSNSMNHSWNIINLDDGWYHTDVTWDDPVAANGQQYCMHDYFLRSDAQFMKLRHYGWLSRHTCDGGKYSSGTMSYEKAGITSYIMKYASPDVYKTEAKRYYYSSEIYVKDISDIPDGADIYYNYSNSEYPYYYNHFVYSYFDGSDFNLCTEAEYKDIKYPLEKIVTTEKFKIDELTGEIVEYIGDDVEIEIPTVIENIEIKSIGDNAFANCTKAEKVTIPKEVLQISDTAFGENKNVVICGEKGSAAETYAQKNSFEFKENVLQRFDYSINAVTYLDADKNVISSPDNQNGFYINVKLKENKVNDTKAYVIIGVYNEENSACEVEFLELNDTGEYISQYGYKNVGRVRVFVWSDADKLIPLAEKYELKIA